MSPPAFLARDDGAQIAWWEGGVEDGEPLLLIMGLGFPASMWFRQLPVLAERFRVIRFDNRGAGETGNVIGVPYSVETMAADAFAVLDAAGIDRAHVVGYSMGGLIAQEMVHAAPDRILSLTLMATHSGLSTMVPADAEVLASFAANLALDARARAEASIPFNYVATTPRELIEEDWAVRLPVTSDIGVTAQFMGVQPWDGSARLGDIEVPTMVLHGEGDRFVPVANGRRLVERIPGATGVFIPDANHILTTDQPEAVVDAITEWVSGQVR